MTNAEVGMYWLLLCFAWKEDGLPTDMQELADYAREPIETFEPTWKRILSRCFFERDGRFYNKRQEEIREEQRAHREARAATGRLGGLAKARAHLSATQGDLSGPLANSGPSSSTSSSTSSSESNGGADAPPAPKRVRPRVPVVDFGDLEPELTVFFAAAADDRKTKTIGTSLVLRLRHELAALRAELANDAAFVHGLRGAARKGADNVTYVRKAALGYEADEARPRPRPISKYQEVSDVQRKLAADREKREAAV